MSKEKEQIVSLRLTKGIVKRVDELLQRLNARTPSKKIKRSEAIRELILKALKVEEAKYGLISSSTKTEKGFYRGYAAIWDGDTASGKGWVASGTINSLEKMIASLKIKNPKAFSQIRVYPEKVDVLKAFEEE